MIFSRKDSQPDQAARGTAHAPIRRPWSRSRLDLAYALAFLAPALLALIMLRLGPLLQAEKLAFSSRRLALTLSTFTRLLEDPVFLGSMKTTLLYGVIVNPLQIALALALAVLVTKRIPLVNAWRALLLLPVAIPQVVSAVIWLILFRPDGPLNGLLERLGLSAVPWLISDRWALWSIILVCSWVGVGYWMTFLVAGIQEIPPSLYEAAAVDGANAWQNFWSITLPGVRRQLLFVLVADTVSNFLVFAPVRVLTQGGPNRSTNLVMHSIFEQAYTVGDLHGASAATIVLVLIVLIVVSIQFRLLPGKE